MGEFKAKFTDDGSVGLYSDEVKDIYHSEYGALSEAYEKFILPSNINEFIKTHQKIKVLDICYGIGYNSKAFLNFYFHNLHEKNNYIKSIHTNNIFDIKNHELTLHGIEIDKNLIKISPLIKQKKFFKSKNKKNIICNLKCLGRNKFYINDEINLILLLKILEKYKKSYLDDEVLKILDFKGNKKFFSQNLAYFIKSYYSEGYKLSYIEHILMFLHNIYYKYISNSYKNGLKVVENRNIDIQLFDVDAREFVKSTKTIYDFVFLDAFTPSKVPSLWTEEFFNQLYKITSDDCMILTYSSSASIRKSFLNNNFYIGKIFNKFENKFTGTIAVKNKSLLKYSLDEFELGLLNTKAGIPYHDNSTLSLTNEEIIKKRENEVKNSTLISTTQYKKEQKCNTMQ